MLKGGGGGRLGLFLSGGGQQIKQGVGRVLGVSCDGLGSPEAAGCGNVGSWPSAVLTLAWGGMLTMVTIASVAGRRVGTEQTGRAAMETKKKKSDPRLCVQQPQPAHS